MMSPHCLWGLRNFEVVAGREGGLTLKVNQLLYCCGGDNFFYLARLFLPGGLSFHRRRLERHSFLYRSLSFILSFILSPFLSRVFSLLNKTYLLPGLLIDR